MVIINLASHNKAQKVITDLEPIADNFITTLTSQINKQLSTVLVSNLNKTWDDVLQAFKKETIKGIIYSQLKQLWNSSWYKGSNHGSTDIVAIHKKNKATKFQEQLQLALFAKDNDNDVGNILKQLQDLVDQQDNLSTKISQLDSDVNNPDRYIKKRLTNKLPTDEQRGLVVETLRNKSTELKVERNNLKKQEDALRYQLNKLTSGDPVKKQELDMLSQDDINQIRKDRKQEKAAASVETKQQAAINRQQSLLEPLDRGKSPTSVLASDIRNRRSTESQRTRDASSQLQEPISISDETEFAKYLDKRYEYIASTLSDNIANDTKANIERLVNSTKNKINTYLSSTTSKRDRELIQGLSPLYPDYGMAARKVLKDTRNQTLKRGEIVAIEDNIKAINDELLNTKLAWKKASLQAELKNYNKQLSAKDTISLNADQAQQLGLGHKATTITKTELERLSKKRSTLLQIKRTAFTELSAAYNYGRFAHYNRDGIELVKWTIEAEHLKMNQGVKRGSQYSGQGVVCKDCLNLSDKNIGYGLGVYPVRLFQSNQMIPPPLHPHCFCYLEPVQGKEGKQILPLPLLVGGAILGGLTIASMAMLNQMFNKTRPSILPLTINELSNPPVRLLEKLKQVQEISEFITIMHRGEQPIALEAPPPVAQPIRLATTEAQQFANNAITELEKPTNTVTSKFSNTSTVKGRNTQAIRGGSAALSNDINAINAAQRIVQESENKRTLFESQFAAAQGNTALQSRLLNQYTKYIEQVNKSTLDLDISQIKLINALNSVSNSLEETKATMQRYQTAESIAPGIVDSDELINNTQSVKRLTDQANTLYNNINNTQQLRNDYRSNLNTIKDSLLNNTEVSNAYLADKAKELNVVDTLFNDRGLSLSNNIDLAESYVNQVKTKVVDKTVTNPVDYEQSLKDLSNAQDVLDQVRNITNNTNLDLDLLSRASQNPTINVNGQPTTIPFSQEQVNRVKSKFDTLNNLEADVNNLQVQLKQLKNNSPQAKDQTNINPRGLNKESVLNDLTRQMGSLVYEQQSLDINSSRYVEITNQLKLLNEQRQQIDTSYFTKPVTDLVLFKKREITVNRK